MNVLSSIDQLLAQLKETTGHSFTLSKVTCVVSNDIHGQIDIAQATLHFERDQSPPIYEKDVEEKTGPALFK